MVYNTATVVCAIRCSKSAQSSPSLKIDISKAVVLVLVLQTLAFRRAALRSRHEADGATNAEHPASIPHAIKILNILLMCSLL